MTIAFADTFYFLAILNTKDAAHQKAVEFSASHETALLTTAWVLTELVHGLADLRHRHAFRKVLDGLRADPNTIIVPPSQHLFEQGVDRYNARSDKERSLTDCISFVVMEQHGVKEALTEIAISSKPVFGRYWRDATSYAKRGLGIASSGYEVIGGRLQYVLQQDFCS